MRTIEQVTKEINDLLRERYTTLWSMSKETHEDRMVRGEALSNNIEQVRALEKERRTLEATSIDVQEDTKDAQEALPQESVECKIATLQEEAIECIESASIATDLDIDAFHREATIIQKSLWIRLHTITTDEYKHQRDEAITSVKDYIIALIRCKAKSIMLESSDI